MICNHRHPAPDSTRNRVLLVAGHVAAGLLLGALLALTFGWFVMLLWNHTLPELLGLRHITYWQSVSLILMTRILVGGIHHNSGHGHTRRNKARRYGWREYDDWWENVGEKSFSNYSESGSEKPKA